MTDKIREKLLFSAAANGDERVCRIYIGEGVNVNSKDSRSMDETPLHAAARQGFVGICQILLSSGADIHARARGGRTPLHIAAGYNRGAPACALLVNLGADVDAKNDIGATALHDAAMTGSIEACRALIAAGASARATSNDGLIPLHSMANSTLPRADQIPEIIEMLVDAGASSSFVPTNPEQGYLTPFQIAVAYGNLEMVKVCLNRYGESIDQRTLDGQTLLDLSKNRLNVKALLLSLATEREVRDAMETCGECRDPAHGRSASMGPL